MIMPRAQRQLLLPANPVFIWGSLLAALAICMLPWGRQPAMPDLLAVVLVFWTVHQPRHVGVVTAFVLGVVIDVHHGALLGQHALSYSLLSYSAVAMSRRILWFGMAGQMLQVLPSFVLLHLVSLLVRMAVGDTWPGVAYLLAPLFETLLWPLVTLLLLAPQRRAPNPDANRPL